jgi:molybdopterin synthase sulfur carrier subunit
MRIYLKLFAVLEKLLPPGTKDHTLELDVPEGTTPRAIIQRMQIPPPLANLVLVDGIHLLKEEIDTRKLQEGESLSIFPPIAGG